jgi:hypothetical protein
MDKAGKLYFAPGNVVAIGRDLDEWKKKASQYYYDGEWYSELATLCEGDLFKAYRIAIGKWTMNYVCVDSSTDGNYVNSPERSPEFDLSGAKKVGGFADGVGNTYQIFQTKSGFALVGAGYCDIEHDYPVANADYINNPNFIGDYGSGVVVLKKT